MRIFIGIEFLHDVKNYLSDIQNIVKNNAIKGNYTLYDNFHLTLRFIGEVDEVKIEELSDLLDEVAEVSKSFEIRIGGLNSFNRSNKHIVYVEVNQNQEKLKGLAKMIEKGLKEYGFQLDDYHFKPHITIGREIVLSQVSILNTLQNYDQPILVNKVSLMLSSRDKNNLLKYTPVYTVELIE